MTTAWPRWRSGSGRVALITGAVRGSRVILDDGWSPGSYVDKPDASWTVEQLATAMEFDHLAEALSGALGSPGRAELQAMIKAQLDAPTTL